MAVGPAHTGDRSVFADASDYPGAGFALNTYGGAVGEPEYGQGLFDVVGWDRGGRWVSTRLLPPTLAGGAGCGERVDSVRPRVCLDSGCAGGCCVDGSDLVRTTLVRRHGAGLSLFATE